MSEHMSPIPSRIYNAAVGGHVAGTDQIIDDETGLTLDKIAGGALEEKEYTSGSNNGMGRVVLRKNLVEGINTLVQTMINKSNTIYVIQYDFTLGENITIPANCVLEFDGGSLSGAYTITGNDTSIKANEKAVIFAAVFFAGTWNITNIYTTWFSDIQQTDRLKQVFNLTSDSIHNNVYLPSNIICNVSNPNNTQNVGCIEIKSHTDFYLDGTIQMETTEYDNSEILLIIGKEDVSIKGNGTIIGDKVTHTGTSDGAYGISIKTSKNILIDGVTVYNCVSDGIFMNINDTTYKEMVNNYTIQNVIIHDCGRCGITVECGRNIVIRNFEIYDCISGCLEFEPYAYTCENVHVYDGKCHGNGMPLNIYENNGVRNCVVKDIQFEHIVFESNNVLEIYYASNITFNDCYFKIGISGEASNSIRCRNTSAITFNSCKFKDYNNGCRYELGNVIIVNCILSGCLVYFAFGDNFIQNCFLSKGRINNVANLTVDNNEFYGVSTNVLIIQSTGVGSYCVITNNHAILSGGFIFTNKNCVGIVAKNNIVFAKNTDASSGQAFLHTYNVTASLMGYNECVAMGNITNLYIPDAGSGQYQISVNDDNVQFNPSSIDYDTPPAWADIA